MTLYLLLPIGAIEGLLVGLGEAQALDMRYIMSGRSTAIFVGVGSPTIPANN
jgi:hypothetical protein